MLAILVPIVVAIPLAIVGLIASFINKAQNRRTGFKD